jgi:hypothetical protein
MLWHRGEAVAVTVEEVFTAVAAVFMAVGEGFMAAADFMVVGEGFMAVGAFAVRAVLEVFMAAGFMAAAGSQAFIEAALGAFMAGVSGGSTAMTVFLFPASMGTRDGGGVIPIIGATRIIGVTRIIPTILIIPITRISRNCPGADSSNSFMRDCLPWSERVLLDNG